MKKCPSCFSHTLEIKIEFKDNGKQILKYSCTKCGYYKQEVVNYTTANIILKNMHSYTAGGSTVGRGW